MIMIIFLRKSIWDRLMKKKDSFIWWIRIQAEYTI